MKLVLRGPPMGGKKFTLKQKENSAGNIRALEVSWDIMTNHRRAVV